MDPHSLDEDHPSKRQKYSSKGDTQDTETKDMTIQNPYFVQKGLRFVVPHPHTYRTNVKARWCGKPILQVFQQEFRDRCATYYEEAVKERRILISGKPCLTSTVLKMGDVIEHHIHRHEPVVPDDGPLVWLRPKPLDPPANINLDHVVILNKPSGVPVHPTGRYYYNSIKEILRYQEGFTHLSNINRLDRPTSGLLLMASDPDTAKQLHYLMENRSIQKDYLAVVRGTFPLTSEKLPELARLSNDEPNWICYDQPIVAVDHKLGLCAISPDGKPSTTLFKRLAVITDLELLPPEVIKYDTKGSPGTLKGSSYSLVHCRPLTGRTHQIRLHLQHMGFPIINDLLYGDSIWENRSADRSQEDLHQIAQVLLEKLLPESFERELVAVRDRFRAEFSSEKSDQVPEWFDAECEECQRQWLRTNNYPHIPLIMPIDGSEATMHGLLLHAFRYSSKDWAFEVPWPSWAKKF